ncbi:unnamed protein product [Spodoptera littoralis]|uniref:Transmembrane protein 9 n=1 Tax=Spodoptera littoralis TaxID=7109 RepID=A0A9P0IIC0_SPOLI|nr:unnamed protein product [Spodoptera littoralis]CAH1647390.1 unnamed protein product [Spodoptera littoralis]
MDTKIIIILMSLVLVKAQFFEDRRCRCVCPSPAAVLNTSTTRQIYTGNVPPNQCNCEEVVFPFIREELEGKLYLFCPRCDCVYQTRNTSLIMAVVSMIIILVMVLILYSIAIWSLKAVLRRRNRIVSRTPASTDQPDTTEQRTEEEQSSSEGGRGSRAVSVVGEEPSARNQSGTQRRRRRQRVKLVITFHNHDLAMLNSLRQRAADNELIDNIESDDD